MSIFFNQLERKSFPDGMSYRALPDQQDDLIIASIRSFSDLLELCQLADTLRDLKLEPELRLHYLIGSRMDRKINLVTPNTLKAVCDTIKNKFSRITCVWPHSQSTLDRLEAYHDTNSECNFIYGGLKWLLDTPTPANFNICLPDSGSIKRYYNDHHSYLKHYNVNVIECGKKRDMATGRLSGFTCPYDVPDHCIIVDDLCDGGGTFSGLAAKLRESGAKRVDLIAYHGILSKGTELEGIDRIYTSNSFKDFKNTGNLFARKVV